MKIAVEIMTAPDGTRFLIDGIPPDVWSSFVERAKVLRPDVENPALAWAALFGDYVDSIANVDNKVIMLRDIPAPELEAFATRCASAGVTITQLLTEMIKSAMKNKFYLTRYAVKRDDKIVRGGTTILITNLTEKAMEPFIKIWEKFKMTPAQIFGQMFSQIERGQVDINIWKEKDGAKVPVGNFDDLPSEPAAQES